jgi:hypothetical protein
MPLERPVETPHHVRDPHARQLTPSLPCINLPRATCFGRCMQNSFCMQRPK